MDKEDEVRVNVTLQLAFHLIAASIIVWLVFLKAPQNWKQQ